MKIRLYLLMALAGIAGLDACKKMDSTYEHFIVPNGIVYPGKATSPVVHSGYKRVNISWLRGTDPKVVKARIYWNNFTDSVELNVPADKDTISYTISNMVENYYSFIIKTFDAVGNVSVPVEVSGNVYGEEYRTALLNRPLISSTLNAANVLTVAFDKMPVGTRITNSEIEYTTTAGELKVMRVDTATLSLVLTNYKPETSYKLRTLYLPDAVAYDTLYSDYLTIDAFSLNKTEWKLVAVSSENPDANAVSVGTNMFDGKPGTRWLTNAAAINNPDPAYPHFITIDLGSVRKIKSVSLWRWQQATPDVRGPDEVQYLVSMDKVTWVNLGSFLFDRFSDNEQKSVIAGLPEARYLKVVPLRGPNFYVILGEMDVSVK